MSLLSVTLILFLIMDPIGHVASLLKLMKALPHKQQRWIIFREMAIALAVMLAFRYIGEWILTVLVVSETTVRLSSGIILFLAAIRILFPGTNSYERISFKMDGEPFVVPIAIPLIAGPSLLATIMLYAHLESLQNIMLSAILLAWFFSSLILLFSPYLQRLLGESGLMACERLMAMILVLLAIQRFLEGVHLFYQGHL